jgi:hypothetical protein
VSGNTASSFGGGIDQTVGPGSLKVRSSTIYGNVAQGDGGGLSSRAGTSLTVRNSIIAANPPQDCRSVPPMAGDPTPPTSGGSNIAGDQTCNLTQSTDLPGTDPRLRTLALNGARTRTHALRIDSPALDAAAPGPSADQRGVARPQGLAPDIGAFELVPRRHLFVPAYFYPGEGGVAWKKMCTRIRDSRASGIVVMNPSNGVFKQADPNYIAAMKDCESKGLAVIGYVFTSHGDRPAADVERSVDRYYADYPRIRGIFFDEMSNDPATRSYYRGLYQFVKDKSTAANTHVVGNPGATASTDWQLRTCLVPACTRPSAPVVDVLVNFEGPYVKRLPPDPAADPAFVIGFKDWTPPAWVSGYSASKFAHLVYRSADAATTRSACVESEQKRGGSLFVTSDDLVPDDPLWNLAPDAAMLNCPTLYRRP